MWASGGLTPEVVARAAAGEGVAVEEVIAAMRGIINNLASKFLRHYPHLSRDDLVQEGILTILRALRTYRADAGASFQTYAYTSIRRSMKAFVESTREPSISPERLERLPSRLGHPDADVDLIAEVVNQLPERMRRVIELRYGLKDGVPLRFDRIGKILGIRRQTAEQIHRRALGLLREHFDGG